MNRELLDKQTGISLRLIRHWDAEEDRKESLRRAQEEIRAWRLWKMPCNQTKQ